MKTFQVTLELVAPYRQSRKIKAVYEDGTPVPKPQRDAWEREEGWKKKMHTNDDGYIVVPAMGLKKALEAAASLVLGKVAGKGQRGWASVFRTGLLMVEDFVTDAAVKGDVYTETNSCDSQGKSGGSRVDRTFPEIPPGHRMTGEITITNPDISPDKLLECLEAAGNYIGVGTFRPENGGYKGRFNVVEFTELKATKAA